LNKDRHRWSATYNRVAASKLLEDFTNFWSWREAESSIRIQEGPPVKSNIYRRLPCSPSRRRTRYASESQYLCAQLETQYLIGEISKGLFADSRKIGKRSE
jgi:hypothetical protein